MAIDLTSSAGPLALPSDQDASGRTLGEQELRYLEDVIRSGTLTSTKGTFVPRLERSFRERFGVGHAVACNSGTSAVHAAIVAVDPEPGDEIITSPITDMGALAPILYQGAIPVFADVDPGSHNLTAATIAERISDRTRAIIVTHLFGRPADMGEIIALATAHGVPIIEDCAQAFLAHWSGQLVGTLGTIACFSLQQGKHITAGEGGMVLTDDEALARRVTLFVNKGWGYGDEKPDHYFLALNSRMSELQGAVGLAQFEKLDGNVAQRIAMAERLTLQIDGIPGISCPTVDVGDVHTYWKYVLRVDEREIEDGPQGLAQQLRYDAIASVPRYIQKPAFECEVFRDQRTFGHSRYPFTLARPEAVDYDRAWFPGTYRTLDTVLVLPINERYRSSHIDYVASSIRQAAER